MLQGTSFVGKGLGVQFLVLDRYLKWNHWIKSRMHF